MIDQNIAHYRITAKIGQGGMGEVYRATDTKLDREVAIKILPEEICSDPARRRRFIKEAKAASALNHPNVCTIYEVSETEDGRPFIAMEFLPGQTLDLLFDKPLDDERVVEIGSQIADALDAAHQVGIIHRDIKPSNIHRDRRGRVKILDFGLAKRMDSQVRADASTAEVTEPGKLMGTPSYMSPEQARGEPLDQRSDLFNVGIVLYQLATGRSPFHGATMADAVEKINHSQPEAIARYNYDTSSELERIIRKCLEKKPENRYQSARELLIDLRRLQRDSGTQVSPSTQRQRSRRSMILLAGALIVAVMLVGLWWSRREVATEDTFRYGKSVAVLPFKVTSEDMTFFADGLCEELTNALGRVEAFDRIPPWSSSSTFRGDAASLEQMAEEMEVSALLQGTVRRAGDLLRISATLVDPFAGRGGAVMWSETFDHNQATALPFAIQDEMVRSIVESLRIELERDPSHQFVQRYTQSPEAYDCYLKGRYFLNQRGPALERAKHWFELALLYDARTGVAEDSHMAPAYVGLADVYNLQAFYGLTPYRDGTAKARQYVDRALEIDDQLAEAYATLGWSELNAGNATAAITAFETSIRLNDRYIPAYQWYAGLFIALGDNDKAASLARKALELDPLSDYSKTVSCWQLSAGAPQETLPILNTVIENDPNYALAHFVKGLALLNLEQSEAAVSSLESSVRVPGGLELFRSALAAAYAKTGRRAEAMQALREVEAASNTGPLHCVYAAYAYLSLGDKERCYQTLEKGMDDLGCLPWLITLDLLEPLFQEQRFIDIVNRSGLLQYNPSTERYEPNMTMHNGSGER